MHPHFLNSLQIQKNFQQTKHQKRVLYSISVYHKPQIQYHTHHIQIPAHPSIPWFPKQQHFHSLKQPLYNQLHPKHINSKFQTLKNYKWPQATQGVNVIHKMAKPSLRQKIPSSKNFKKHLKKFDSFFTVAMETKQVTVYTFPPSCVKTLTTPFFIQTYCKITQPNKSEVKKEQFKLINKDELTSVTAHRTTLIPHADPRKQRKHECLFPFASHIEGKIF